MTTMAKPSNRAFVLKKDKTESFLRQEGSSDKTMDRFFAHKPKTGVVTPLKGKNV